SDSDLFRFLSSVVDIAGLAVGELVGVDGIVFCETIVEYCKTG
ncbi:unnamed protein product, partial [Rotaria sp. Silwood1]